MIIHTSYDMSVYDGHGSHNDRDLHQGWGYQLVISRSIVIV